MSSARRIRSSRQQLQQLVHSCSESTRPSRSKSSTVPPFDKTDSGVRESAQSKNSLSRNSARVSSYPSKQKSIHGSTTLSARTIRQTKSESVHCGHRESSANDSGKTPLSTRPRISHVVNFDSPPSSKHVKSGNRAYIDSEVLQVLKDIEALRPRDSCLVRRTNGSLTEAIVLERHRDSIKVQLVGDRRATKIVKRDRWLDCVRLIGKKSWDRNENMKSRRYNTRSHEIPMPSCSKPKAWGRDDSPRSSVNTGRNVRRTSIISLFDDPPLGKSFMTLIEDEDEYLSKPYMSGETFQKC